MVHLPIRDPKMNDHQTIVIKKTARQHAEIRCGGGECDQRSARDAVVTEGVVAGKN